MWIRRVNHGCRIAGNGLIYENGTLLAASERFCLEEQLIISEIDIERIRTERRINTTFAANAANCSETKAIRLSTEMVNKKEFELTRTIKPLPFVPSDTGLNERCEEIFSIQVSGLAKRLIHTNCKRQ